jgi:ABC-type sugar transport system ATPase subunit
MSSSTTTDDAASRRTIEAVVNGRRASMRGIKLEKVTKTFGKKRALDGVTLEIEEGSFVCLLGPTGSGKTTLLRILAGVETPGSGAVYLDGEDVTLVPPNKRPVSMVFENFALYPNMSVFRNIASPLVARKLPKKEIEQKVAETAAFLRIDRLLKRRISQLSGGEMQRVAIARALCKEAKLVLFDEIFVNLDYKLREQMRIEFRELMDRVKLTTIFSTPDPEDAFMLADKVAVIRDGRIRQFDSKEVAYERPVDAFTGAYFGYPEMNLLDCDVAREDGALTLQSSILRMPVVADRLGELEAGSYSLGVRPEHLKIHAEAVPSGPVDGRSQRSVLEGKVLLTEVVGSDTIVHVGVGSHAMEVFTPGIYREDVGKRVYLSFDPRDIYLFEKAGGRFVGRGA